MNADPAAPRKGDYVPVQSLQAAAAIGYRVPMNILIPGLIVFFAAHLVPYTALKPALRERLGEAGYKGLFSVASLAGLGLIVWGFQMSRYGPADADLVYNPPESLRHLTMLLVLLGFISLAAYWHKGRLKLWLRNPMSVGVALWAIGHLLANGQMSHVLLFGSFLVYALFDIAYNTAKGNRPSFAPKPVHDLIAVVAGVILFGVFAYGFHPYILNLPVFD
jgi:uncharacterized membrane protein